MKPEVKLLKLNVSCPHSFGIDVDASVAALLQHDKGLLIRGSEAERTKKYVVGEDIRFPPSLASSRPHLICHPEPPEEGKKGRKAVKDLQMTHYCNPGNKILIKISPSPIAFHPFFNIFE